MVMKNALTAGSVGLRCRGVRGACPVIKLLVIPSLMCVLSFDKGEGFEMLGVLECFMLYLLALISARKQYVLRSQSYRIRNSKYANIVNESKLVKTENEVAMSSEKKICVYSVFACPHLTKTVAISLHYNSAPDTIFPILRNHIKFGIPHQSILASFLTRIGHAYRSHVGYAREMVQ